MLGSGALERYLSDIQVNPYVEINPYVVGSSTLIASLKEYMNQWLKECNNNKQMIQ